MTKQSKCRRAVGKGKLTPAQVAFIVGRYLADNGCTNTFSAFRAEAGELLPKTDGSEAPKGLLGLVDILDEYISLKEQRMAVDQEKRRVEAALHGMQEVMRVFYSAATRLPLHPPFLLPDAAATTPTATAVFISPSNSPSNMSPSGQLMHGTAPMNCAQPSLGLPNATKPNKILTHIPNSSSANKREASKSAPRVPPATKKYCIQQTIASSMVEGDKENMVNSAVQPASINNEIIKSPFSGSSVAKSLFKQQPRSRANSSSPKTPPPAFPSQADKSVSPEDLSFVTTDTAISKEFASTDCSIISSEAIIVSPLKQTGLYAVDRKFQVTSPFNSSPKKLSKRDHVKGRLYFDEPDMSTNLEKPVVAGSSTLSTDGETPGTFDYDLPDLDFFNGEISLSGLLADIERLPSSQLACIPADYFPESNHNTSNVCSETKQSFSAFHLSTVTGLLSEKDMNIQGSDPVTSVKAITECINVSSPANENKK